MKINTDPGHFTVRGGPDVERDIKDVATEVTARILANIPAGTVAAVLLVGGYGRGEGGVVVEDGRQKAHNNLDFMLLTTPLSRLHHDMKATLDAEVEEIRQRTGFGIDLGFMPLARLALFPRTVFWYDFYHGHKVLAGSEKVVHAFHRPKAAGIDPLDILNLLVNRGTLMVINQVLCSQMTVTDRTPKAIVRHAMKAIIGYGDALLFFKGAYSWSYLEKAANMKARSDVPQYFKDTYNDAMEFRFQPEYAAFTDRNPVKWTSELVETLKEVHLTIESSRLKRKDLTWDTYLERAVCGSYRQAITSPIFAIKVARGVHRNLHNQGGHQDLLFRMAPEDLKMATVFPAVIYDLDGEIMNVARDFLNVGESSADDGGAGSDINAVRKAWLVKWGLYNDPNFAHAAKKLGLNLEV